MMVKLICSLLCCVSSTLPFSAMAQEADTTRDSSQIIVQGSRDIDREIDKFVSALSELPITRQLSKFEKSVCPIVFGLPQAEDDAIAARMRKVAEAAGIRVSGADCVANVVVIITADKGAFLKALRRKRPEYFDAMEAMQVRQVLAQAGPATAWQLKGAPLSARGTEIPFDIMLGMYKNTSAEPETRLRAAARPQFDAAVVVIEANAVEGLTTTQVADYAAMRAYAGTNPTRLKTSSGTTILKVLEAPMGTEVPASLTRWDLGFLRGLYNSPDNLYAGAHRGAIAQEIRRQTEEKPPGKR